MTTMLTEEQKQLVEEEIDTTEIREEDGTVVIVVDSDIHSRYDNGKLEGIVMMLLYGIWKAEIDQPVRFQLSTRDEDFTAEFDWDMDLSRSTKKRRIYEQMGIDGVVVEYDGWSGEIPRDSHLSFTQYREQVVAQYLLDNGVLDSPVSRDEVVQALSQRDGWAVDDVEETIDDLEKPSSTKDYSIIHPADSAGKQLEFTPAFKEKAGLAED